MNPLQPQFAIKSIATQVHRMRGTARLSCMLLLSALLGACAGLVDKPVQRTLYDFGPGASAPAAATRQLPPLGLSEIDAAGALDGTAVLYRLGYADANQLRPYAQARWSAPPPQLVRQRLREQLGRERAVLNPAESASLAREGGVLPRVLHIELEEFSHLFESPAQSFGLVRMRATLLENTVAGEKLLAQRSVVARSPAATADAPGGVRALAAATDAAAAEIGQWLQQAR
jgi:cholesterol transport system auxiliary component